MVKLLPFVFFLMFTSFANEDFGREFYVPIIIEGKSSVVIGGVLSDSCQLKIDVKEVLKGGEKVKYPQVLAPIPCIDKDKYLKNTIFYFSKLGIDGLGELVELYPDKSVTAIRDFLKSNQAQKYMPKRSLAEEFHLSRTEEHWYYGTQTILYVVPVFSLWGSLCDLWKKTQYFFSSKLYYHDRARLTYVKVKDVLRGDKNLKDKILRVNYYDRPDWVNDFYPADFEFDKNHEYLLNLYQTTISDNQINFPFLPYKERPRPREHYPKFPSNSWVKSFKGHGYDENKQRDFKSFINLLDNPEFTPVKENLTMTRDQFLGHYNEYSLRPNTTKEELNFNLNNWVDPISVWQRCISEEEFCINPIKAGLKLKKRSEGLCRYESPIEDFKCINEKKE